MLWFPTLTLALALSNTVVGSVSAATRSSVDYGLVDWLNGQPDGYFNPKQEIRREGVHSRLGIFAIQPIAKGEVLSNIPWDAMIVPTDAQEEVDIQNEDLPCATVRLLAKELAFGANSKTSKFEPYVQYLLQEQPTPIPAAWSDKGKELLLEILGGIEQEIPPGSATSMLDEEWLGFCKGGTDHLEAAALVKQKGLDTSMIPMSDLYTHRNGGEFYNVHVDFEDDMHYKVLARRDIQVGEQLHDSLNLCDECNLAAVEQGYGTAEIFRDYGIIEEYPQHWTITPGAVEIATDNNAWLYSPEQISFELKPNGDSLQVEWGDHLIFDNKGRNYVRRLFRAELKRLYRFQNIMYDLEQVENTMSIPTKEWDSIRAFYHAIRDAFRYAIHSLVNEVDDDGDGDDDDETSMAGECTDDDSTNEGFCKADLIDVYGIHYDDLKDEEDNLNYILPTCQTSQIVEFFNYEDLEGLQTNYQKLWFMERDPDHDGHEDICMNIENTLQICSEYRPHYHEFFVHFPARFIDKIERVVFVGGGDSMLLHEVLKYPTLKKVVGLELDQQVTRKSFKWFNSQPHWDNDKVEWWYGDATKSLPLLPKDYWGSFDLVLVDLSETVMSLSVTGELDIFAALSLLLKPEGIMVKNEPYIDKFSTFFDHSIHIFYGTPKICTQVLVMGSNKVDFMHHPVKEHEGVEHVLLEPLDDPDDRFKYYHDYRKTNARAQGKCKEGSVGTQHGRKAGILDIVEAENTSVPLDGTLEANLYAAIKKEGFTPISSPSQDGGGIVIVLEEGYVVARLRPEVNYVAFDMNLWGAFSQMPSLKAALTNAVGSTTLSSFRIVVGGMHGSSTWDKDQDTIGIDVAQTRNCNVKESSNVKTDVTVEEATALAIEESLTLNPESELNIVVACGFQDSKDADCLGYNTLFNHEKVGKIMPLWTCPELKGDIDDPLDFSAMYTCEKQLLARLEKFVVDEDVDIDMFIVDTSAPPKMLQILNSVWGYVDNREEWLSERHVFVSVLTNTPSDDERLRRNFLERYRKDSHRVPISRGEVVMTVGPTVVELGVVSKGDKYFFNNLSVVESTLRTKLPSYYNVEVKSIVGGIHYYDSEYDVKVFEPEAYDAQPALNQASTQKSLGRQCIFQLEFFSSGEDEGVDPTEMPSFDQLTQFLKGTQEQMELVSTRFETFANVGDGALIISVLSDGGEVILVWDGLHHVDLNFFSTNESDLYADLFVDTFTSLSSSLLQVSLRDDQPRGTGGVVQFQGDDR